MIEPPIPSRNPLEQLEYMLCKGAKITRVSETPVASNDLPYCYVEFTGSTGTQYVIHAYVNRPRRIIFERHYISKSVTLIIITIPLVYFEG